MSRISNDLAKQIAFKLTEKSRLTAEKLHVDFRELVTTIYEEQTPQEIKDVYKKHPDYFFDEGNARINGHGFRYEYVVTTRQILPNSNQNNIELTSKLADKITAAKRKWEKAKKSYEELKEETKHALLALRTFANIRKEIPDAAQYLPPPLSNALVCNFTTLNKRLSSQPEVKKELVS